MPLRLRSARVSNPSPHWKTRTALTLVEVMIAMGLLGGVALGFLGTFVQSRRVAEASVMHAAATSLVYGLIEQMKGFDYVNLMPSTATDANQATLDAFPGAGAKSAPYIRVRINQDQVTWLQCLYTPAPGTPQAPTTTPPESSTAASLSVPDNLIGPLPLSSVTSSARSQALNLHLWIWIDEMPDVTHDVTDVKRVTLVYSYTYNDGNRVRTAIDREVFVRTRFDQ